MQREMDIRETRCRTALQQVCWERVEAMGRWAMDTLQWRLNKIILLQHRRHWDRGWLQLRAQEEVDKLRAQEGKQWQQIVSKHMQALASHER